MFKPMRHDIQLVLQEQLLPFRNTPEVQRETTDVVVVRRDDVLVDILNKVPVVVETVVDDDVALDMTHMRPNVEFPIPMNPGKPSHELTQEPSNK